MAQSAMFRSRHYQAGCNPEWDYDMSLRDMCDKGARNVAAGKYNVIKFSIMPNEREKVRAYMAEHHPRVKFFCSWPSWPESK